MPSGPALLSTGQEVAPLGDHVAHVVAVRTQEEVIGPYTSAVVAVVADEKPFTYLATRQFVRHSVGIGSRPFAVYAAAYLPVPTRLPTCRPFPTPITLLNLHPEA
jgi:hypothetical protein